MERRVSDKLLNDWESSLNERINRCLRTSVTPKKLWYDALAAIGRYRVDTSDENLETLKVTLRASELYVPRDL